MLRKARDELIRKLNHLQSLLQVIKKPPDDKIFNLKSPDLQILKSLITLHLLLITVTTFSCRERVTPPDIPPYIPPILLAVEDTSCTDAFIRIKTTKAFDGGVLQLRREGTTKVEITNLNSQLDTLVMDEGLLPKREYRYRAYRVVNSTAVDSSMELIVRTMDTTSSAWQWAIDTLGEMNSYLVDCAIINDTLAYAVGEIYKRDSTGNWDPQPYGLAVWNGHNWTLRRIMVVSQQGDVHSRVLKGVYAFSATDVWFGDGNAFHWDGQSTFATAYWISGYPGNPTPVLGPNQGVHKFWGTSSSNLYGVGVNGGIAHYDGVRWRRIESETDVDINDIWGYLMSDNNKLIMCGASNITSSSERKIIIIREDLSVVSFPWMSDYEVHSLWYENGKRIFAAGDGVWLYRNNKWTQYKELPRYYKQRIRGQAINDIVTVGHFGLVAHYNGYSWKTYNNLAIADVYYSVDFRADNIIAVGDIGSRAVILRMWRKK